jgi:hypothetical protein
VLQAIALALRPERCERAHIWDGCALPLRALKKPSSPSVMVPTETAGRAAHRAQLVGASEPCTRSASASITQVLERSDCCERARIWDGFAVSLHAPKGHAHGR